MRWPGERAWGRKLRRRRDPTDWGEETAPPVGAGLRYFGPRRRRGHLSRPCSCNSRRVHKSWMILAIQRPAHTTGAFNFGRSQVK
jgi:hypothetical protein